MSWSTFFKQKHPALFQTCQWDRSHNIPGWLLSELIIFPICFRNTHLLSGQGLLLFAPSPATSIYSELVPSTELCSFLIQWVDSRPGWMRLWETWPSERSPVCRNLTILLIYHSMIRTPVKKHWINKEVKMLQTKKCFLLGKTEGRFNLWSYIWK